MVGMLLSTLFAVALLAATGAMDSSQPLVVPNIVHQIYDYQVTFLGRIRPSH